MHLKNTRRKTCKFRCKFTGSLCWTKLWRTCGWWGRWSNEDTRNIIAFQFIDIGEGETKVCARKMCLRILLLNKGAVVLYRLQTWYYVLYDDCLMNTILINDKIDAQSELIYQNHTFSLLHVQWIHFFNRTNTIHVISMRFLLWQVLI